MGTNIGTYVDCPEPKIGTVFNLNPIDTQRDVIISDKTNLNPLLEIRVMDKIHDFAIIGLKTADIPTRKTHELLPYPYLDYNATVVLPRLNIERKSFQIYLKEMIPDISDHLSEANIYLSFVRKGSGHKDDNFELSGARIAVKASQDLAYDQAAVYLRKQMEQQHD